MRSWNEQASGRKLPSYSDAQKTKRLVSNGTVKCECGARKVNGLNNDDNRLTDKRTDSVQLKSNSRVGSKYLQALASNTENRRYIKRDSSVGEKSERKSLYSSRSRSIENFHNQHYLSTEPLLAKSTVIEETTTKHHTSYGDLYNGRISSKESVNGNRHSPSLNGQSTDTDYSSDGGYKSLPSSINYNGNSPKKISGIPRRSIEQKYVPPKQIRASAIWMFWWHPSLTWAIVAERYCLMSVQFRALWWNVAINFDKNSCEALKFFAYDHVWKHVSSLCHLYSSQRLVSIYVPREA